MGNLLVKENAVLIRNMAAEEIAHYASIEFADDPVSSEFIRIHDEGNKQLELEMRDLDAELDSVRDELRDAEMQVEDLEDSERETRAAINKYLDTNPPASPELDALKDKVK